MTRTLGDDDVGAPGPAAPRPVGIERRLALSNSRWNVYLDRLTDDHGNEVPDYLVIEGKLVRPDRVAGVCILPILGARYALVQCYRHALRSQLWEAPKGFVDSGETLTQAALRELHEETGLACAPADLIPLGIVAPEASTLGGRAAMFVATRCTGAPRTGAGEIGLGRVRLFDEAEFASLEAARGIEDAVTLLAHYRHLTALRVPADAEDRP